MQFVLAIRGQFPPGDNMNVRFEELMAQVRLAKQLGFTGIAKSCHYSSSPWQEIQQIPFLARAAAEAPGLNFITSIVLLPLHKPLEIAEQTAALDLFTGGRFILGVGIGYRDVEFKAFGTSREERVPRLVENIQAIRRLWTEDAVTMKGSHFELDGAVCSLKPRRPPPIWIGANADPAIRRAAHIADSWMINPHNRIDTILRQIEVYKRGLDEAGKPWPETLPLAREMFVARTRAEAIRLARPYLEAKYKAYHDWGQGDAMPEGDNDLGQEFDELARDRFLFGSADEVAEQIIGMMKATGANQLSCPIQWPGMPHEVVVEQMHVMAEEVVPLVKQGL